MMPFRPLATYRIQFNENFRFRHAHDQIEYWKDLGIDTIYASPIFAAVPGSTHGYDVVDPLRINSEIGTEDELLELTQALRNSGISWVQDIVPNHMAFHPDNTYLMDVLQRGQTSPYASFFDLDVAWQHGEKLLVPFLTESPETLIAKGSLLVVRKSDQYFIHDGNTDWPISTETRLWLDEVGLSAINQSRQHLEQLLSSQHYQLCDWKSAAGGVNYRRFFTVNGLICLNMQTKEVFEKYHQYIFELVRKGIFQGLRIDHVDGLYDPTGYLKALRSGVGPECYITVEKILGTSEKLPEDWPVQGSTGYDFLGQLNNLFTRSGSIAQLEDIYREITGKIQSPFEKKSLKKQFILASEMQGELRRLAKMLILITGETLSLSQAEAYVQDILVNMPVYRFYDMSFPLKEAHFEQIAALLINLENRASDAKSASFWRKWLLEFPLTASTAELKQLALFFGRLMQYSGPVMAKGIEDTLMYTYNRFTVHAEVGDQAESFGMSRANFHALMEERQHQQPLSINATATHDTKKGEDVRARLNVLSDMPDDWRKAISEVMERYSAEILASSLHPNDLYLLMQVLVGIFPWKKLDREDLADRLGSFMTKALREGKNRSEWGEPDVRYEEVVEEFIEQLCNDLESADHPLIKLLDKIRLHAALNTFSQVILKVCCPGVPDFYQGTEAFDLSLVDPDNRRPVNYSHLATEMRKNRRARGAVQPEEYPEDSAKIALVRDLLQIRKKYRAIFEKGEYIPLETTGKYRDHALAFLRRMGGDWVLVAIPLGTGYLIGAEQELVNFDWEDTGIQLPVDAPQRWKNLLSDEPVAEDVLCTGLPLSAVFRFAQAGVCVPDFASGERSSGILLHISSLPSEGLVGNFGADAYRFVDFLQAASQRYWQILPLSPVSAQRGYSPYATWSDRAGNLQFIAPDLLQEWGLLKTIPSKNNYGLTDHADFFLAGSEIEMLLDEAFKAFTGGSGAPDLEIGFNTFKTAQSSWLNDYALYRSLSLAFQGSWRSWPEAFKWREKAALENYQSEYAPQLERYRWEQFIFWKQWHHLKAYANKKGIKIIGDLPFYLDLDSVEVWCNPQYFKLDGEGETLFQAGVPPDYFNSEGQLWGMPVYHWENIAVDGYRWWLDRIAYQCSRVDEVRLDHFRAFSSYYEVAGGSTHAKNGNWQKSPGHSLLSRLRERMGKLPLIAEDLGDITADVRMLMEDFGLPGMKVLQFAFDASLLNSPHIPHAPNFHNGIVYTGTHDNNTTRGWFKHDLDSDAKKRLQAYLGQPCGEEEVAHQLIRLAQSSPAFRVTVPMQDILALDESARMNRPGTATGNWGWRLKGDEDYKAIADQLKLLSKLYGRTE